jgi:ribose/xylose/arabinose/galactoside ABC-type transport system permease subunit
MNLQDNVIAAAVLGGTSVLGEVAVGSWGPLWEP